METALRYTTFVPRFMQALRSYRQMETKPCGNQDRDPLGSIHNSYQRCSVFPSLSGDRLSQLMVVWIYSALLDKYSGSFLKQVSNVSIIIFLSSSFHCVFCNEQLLIASLNKHTPEDRSTLLLHQLKALS